MGLLDRNNDKDSTNREGNASDTSDVTAANGAQLAEGAGMQSTQFPCHAGRGPRAGVAGRDPGRLER